MKRKNEPINETLMKASMKAPSSIIDILSFIYNFL